MQRNIQNEIKCIGPYRYINNEAGRNPKECLVNDDNKDWPLLIHEEGRGYYLFNTVTAFIDWYNNKNPKHCYEHIRKFQNRKIYLDIDGDAEKFTNLVTYTDTRVPPVLPTDESISEWCTVMGDDFNSYKTAKVNEYNEAMKLYNNATIDDIKRHYVETTITKALLEHFPNITSKQLDVIDIIKCSSSNDKKFSLHFIIDKYWVTDNDQNKEFYNRFVSVLPPQVAKFVDGNVYHAGQDFRLALSSKSKDPVRVKKIISGHLFTDSLITFVCKIEPYKIEFKESHKTVEKVKIVDENTVNKVIEVTKQFREFTYRNKTNGVFNFDRNVASHCDLCNRIHDRDNTFYVTINHRNIERRCRRSDKFVVIGKIDKKFDIEYKISKVKTDDVIGYVKSRYEHFDYFTYCEDQVVPFDLLKNDLMLVKSPMGTGKTKQLLTELKSNYDGIIYLSFRRSHSDKTVNDFHKYKLVDYRETTGDITDTKIVLQIDSLWRLKVSQFNELNSVLILDEIESLLTQFESNYIINAGHLRQCWTVFEYLLKNCSKVIGLDADITVRSCKLLESIAKKLNKKVTFHHNTMSILHTKTDYYYQSKTDFITKILQQAQLNYSPFVVTANKRSFIDDIEVQIRQVNNNLKIKKYTSKSSAEERNDLKDVNNSWVDVDVLLYTSTITAGISFECERFKTVYGYFTPFSCDYQICNQMLGRCRNIESNEYHLHLEGSKLNIAWDEKLVETVVTNIHYKVNNFKIYNPITANLPQEVNSNGEFVIPNIYKDLYYYTHLRNVMHRFQSASHFIGMFAKVRKEAGNCIELIKHQGDEDKYIADEQKRIRNENVEKECRLISNAPNLTEKEMELCEELVKTNELKGKEYSYAKMKLAAFYGVLPDQVSPDFVRNYSNDTVKGVYTLSKFALRDKRIALYDDFTERSVIDKTLNELLEYVNTEVEREKESNRNAADRLSCKYDETMIKLIVAANIINQFTGGAGNDLDVLFTEKKLNMDQMDKVVEALGKHQSEIRYLYDIRNSANHYCKG